MSMSIHGELQYLVKPELWEPVAKWRTFAGDLYLGAGYDLSAYLCADYVYCGEHIKSSIPARGFPEDMLGFELAFSVDNNDDTLTKGHYLKKEPKLDCYYHQTYPPLDSKHNGRYSDWLVTWLTVDELREAIIRYTEDNGELSEMGLGLQIAYNAMFLSRALVTMRLIIGFNG